MQSIIIALGSRPMYPYGSCFTLPEERLNDRALAIFLGLAAGVMAAVVLMDMMPSALLYDWKAVWEG